MSAPITENTENVHHSLDLTPEPRSAGTARRFVAEHVHGHVPDETAEVAALLTSELVTNAIVHAHTPMRLHVDVTDEAVRVAVADEMPRLPTPRRSHDARLTGRGMNLVSALATQWGVDPRPRGKTVWFELPTSG